MPAAANAALTRLGVRTAHESVTSVLRAAIITGELRAGTRLVQSELAQALSVSTTPVREALRDLITEGLVDNDRFRGAVVHVPSADELRELYDMRCALVRLNVPRAVANITEAELADADRIAAALTQASDDEWAMLNIELHDVLDQASRTAHLAGTLVRLSRLAALYVNHCVSTPGRFRGDAADEHLELVDAYRRRDAARATELYLQHLTATVRTVEAAGLDVP